MHRQPLLPASPTSETAGGAWPWPAPPEVLLALAADWVWTMDAQFRLARMARIDGQPLPSGLEQALGVAPWDSPLFEPGHGHWRRHRRVLWSHRPFAGLELGWHRPGQPLRWFAISGMPRFDDHGRFAGYVGVAVDITARKRTEQTLREVRADLTATLRALPDLMFEVDREGTFHHVHAPRPELLLVPPQAIVGRNQRDLLPPQALRVAEQALAQAERDGHAHGYRYALQLPDGWRWFELSVARKDTAATRTPRFVVLVRDITELKRREAELSELAFYDTLTGLPNRRLLLDRIEQALLRQAREPSWCALLFIDLDDFKAINDRHGHGVGDQVLAVVAQRLRAGLRETDPLGRLAGDEFVALLPDLGEDAATARRVAQRVARTLVRMLRMPLHERPGVVPSASVGVLMFRGHHPLPALLAQADTLMYRAKDAGKGRLTLRWFGRDAPSPCPPAP
ncbi:putative diguanylate cyclase YdaM [Tepidimonas sediminis]|uniref:Putative diguanylate cyclase YdaM n=1 Tax=Tepidimonas sediminis TaxID=2588941 RepID=A0A554WUT3_9BURK|nr:diguanylate cyclase [Tepidimonas sediminis]TSE27331.1 putative diguanylate cyclase YdaM [Tepidimonas sediminis]